MRLGSISFGLYRCHTWSLDVDKFLFKECSYQRTNYVNYSVSMKKLTNFILQYKFCDIEYYH